MVENLPIEIMLSRIQMALTLAFHILFPTLTIGLAGFLACWEIAWLRTRNPAYYRLCRFWSKIFALAFGMGVVSGIVLSYEFGTNFSRFSEMAGNIIGPLMSYEVLTAFFLEAGFLGIMLFGWHRVSEGMHLVATLLVMIGTFISTFWIIAANSWMHTPTGYRLEEGIFYAARWLDIMFNPSFPYRLLHMVTASYLTTAFFVAGISAWYLLKGRETQSARPAFSFAMLIACVLAPAQLWIGDLHGLNSLQHQPMKIAAIEGHWETKQGAPLILFAIPDVNAETNHYTLEIPKLGSLILTHQWDGEVAGLKSVAKEDRPYVPLVFFTFRIMVGIGMWFMLLGLVSVVLRLRGRLYHATWFHRLCLSSTPLGFVAVIAGWFTTEVGRQPWVVHGLLRTRDAASHLPANEVLTTLIAFGLLYTSLLTTFIFYLVKLIRRGPETAPMTHTPDRLTAWLEKKL